MAARPPPSPKAPRPGVAFAAVALLLAAALPSAPAAAQPTRAVQSFGTETIGGYQWTTDIQVTSSPLDDHHAQLQVDASYQAHLLWTRNDSLNGTIYYERIARSGDVTHAETLLRERASARPALGTVRGSQIGIDSKGDIHYVFDDGSQNIRYMKYDEDGNVLTAAKNVGPLDGSYSFTPSLAIGIDDTVHISHAEYKFQCADIAYDKLANDGSDIWIDRIVSSDVASQAEDSLIKVSPFSGNILFTFGSANGSWLGRYNKFGTKDMPSVKFRNQSDWKIADVAEAPDGSIHLVWEDGGDLHYTRVNATGVKTIDDSIVVNLPNVAAFPRVAAASDSRVFIAWSETNFQSAIPQVMYLISMPGSDPRNAEKVQLTTSSGGATEPAIAVDPDDSLAVAWTDTRSGGADIYLKRMQTCAAQLFADPLDVSHMLFLRPNQTMFVPLLLKNKGWLAGHFSLNYSWTPGPGTGWDLWITPGTEFDLNASETTAATLFVHAPANATRGQAFSVRLNLSNVGQPVCFDEMEITSYVQVSRSIQLAVDAGTKFGDDGDNVTFDMVVRNAGDVREDPVRLQQVVGAGPSNWTVTLDKAQVALDPNESAPFTVTISIPPDAPGLVSEVFGITAFSAADSSASSFRQLTVGVRGAVGLTLGADGHSRHGDPGEAISYRLTVAATGNIASPMQVNLDVGHLAPRPYIAELSADTLFLRGGENFSVDLTVVIPSDAAVGGPYTLTVEAWMPRYGINASIDLGFTVNSICDLRVTAPHEAARVVNGVGVGSVEVQNNGNQAVALLPTVSQIPEGWAAFVGAPLGPDSNAPLGAGLERIYPLNLTAPARSTAGNYSVGLHFEAAPCGAVDLLVPVEIPELRGVHLEAANDEAQILPGGEAVFELRLTNLGNTDPAVRLSIDLSYPNFDGSVTLLSADGSTELGDALVAPIQAGAFGSVQLRARLAAPNERFADLGGLAVTASLPTGESDTVLLSAIVVRSDLQPLRIEIDPLKPVEGERTTVRVWVHNLGQTASPGGRVRMAVDDSFEAEGVFGPLGANETVMVEVTWLAVRGDHRLDMVIEEVASGSEEYLGDNTITAQMTVAPPARAPASPSLAPWAAGIALAACAAAALALWQRRRQP